MRVPIDKLFLPLSIQFVRREFTLHSLHISLVARSDKPLRSFAVCKRNLLCAKYHKSTSIRHFESVIVQSVTFKPDLSEL